jgi:hypothetical protein
VRNEIQTMKDEIAWLQTKIQSKPRLSAVEIDKPEESVNQISSESEEYGADSFVIVPTPKGNFDYLLQYNSSSFDNMIDEHNIAKGHSLNGKTDNEASILDDDAPLNHSAAADAVSSVGVFAVGGEPNSNDSDSLLASGEAAKDEEDVTLKVLVEGSNNVVSSISPLPSTNANANCINSIS